MPVYNSGIYLRKAVDSILCQSLKDIELILVDDGSTDGSGEVCDKYAKQDTRVKVIHEKNCGICVARNNGMQIASGNYIAFSDHDDEYMPGLLENTYSEAKKYNLDIVKFQRKELVIKGDKLIDIMPSEGDNIQYSKKGIIDHFFELEAIGTFERLWDGIYRRQLLIENNVKFDVSFKKGGEDIIFMYDLLPYIDSIAILKETYYLHYIRIGFSTSSKINMDDTITDIKHIYDISCRRIRKLGVDVDGLEKFNFACYLFNRYIIYTSGLYFEHYRSMGLSKKELRNNLNSLKYAAFIPQDFFNYSIISFWKQSRRMGISYLEFKYNLIEIHFIVSWLRSIKKHLLLCFGLN